MNPIKEVVRRLLPYRYRPLGAAIYWFGFRHQCPICGWYQRSFRPLSIDPRFMDLCSRCGSLGRHRLLWLFLKQKTELFTAPNKLLHFAAEPCFSTRLSRLKNLDYTTADIAGGDTPGMEKLDVTAIDKADNTFDCILCLHVLHQVLDDRLGMREILRVLKPGGWAILNSRMDLGLETTNDTFVHAEPEVRREHLGAADQLRIYGRDFGQRIAQQGFEVQEVPFLDEIGSQAAEKYYLKTTPVIYLARKPR